MAQQNETDWVIQKYGCYTTEILYTDISKTDKSTWSRVTGITTCVLVAFVVVTNSMFILGLVKTNKRNMTLVQKLFIYISAVDLFNGVLAMPCLAFFSLNGISCLAMSFMVGITAFTVLSSTSTLAIISIIRLHSIIYPFAAKNGTKVALSVILQSLVSIGLAAILFENYLRAKSLSILVPVACSISALLFSLQAGVVGCNLFSLIYLRKQRETCHQHKPRQQQVPENRDGVQALQTTCHVTNNRSSAKFKFLEKQFRNHREAAKTFLLMSGFLGVIVLIQTLMAIVIFTNANKTHIHLDGFNTIMDLTGILTMLVDVNSGMNAFICMCRSHKIQKYYKARVISLLLNRRFCSKVGPLDF